MFPLHESVTIEPLNPVSFATLALKALNQGISLVGDKAGHVFATSHSRPGLIHEVNHTGCGCEAFHFSGQCKHHSLFLAELSAAVGF